MGLLSGHLIEGYNLLKPLEITQCAFNKKRGSKLGTQNLGHLKANFVCFIKLLGGHLVEGFNSSKH